MSSLADYLAMGVMTIGVLKAEKIKNILLFYIEIMSVFLTYVTSDIFYYVNNTSCGNMDK